jgi:DNA-binding NarL/FixJ family response regulator
MKNSKKIKLMLVDDHPVVIDGLKAGLLKYPEIEVSTISTMGKDVLHLAKKNQPDVLLLDLGLPDISGIEVAKILKMELPDLKIIIYTMYNEPEYLKTLLPLGVKGFLLKESSINEVVKAITLVSQGGNYFSAKHFEKIFESTESPNPKKETAINKSENVDILTVREKEVLVLVAKGKKNKEIAEELNVNLRTVETHRRNLMLKLKIKTAAGLVKYAIENL